MSIYMVYTQTPNSKLMTKINHPNTTYRITPTCHSPFDKLHLQGTIQNSYTRSRITKPLPNHPRQTQLDLKSKRSSKGTSSGEGTKGNCHGTRTTAGLGWLSSRRSIGRAATAATVARRRGGRCPQSLERTALDCAPRGVSDRGDFLGEFRVELEGLVALAVDDTDHAGLAVVYRGGGSAVELGAVEHLGVGVLEGHPEDFVLLDC